MRKRKSTFLSFLIFFSLYLQQGGGYLIRCSCIIKVVGLCVNIILSDINLAIFSFQPGARKKWALVSKEEILKIIQLFLIRRADANNFSLNFRNLQRRQTSVGFWSLLLPWNWPNSLSGLHVMLVAPLNLSLRMCKETGFGRAMGFVDDELNRIQF